MAQIIFTFSRGNMELTDEITMIDFTNQSKLKTHLLTDGFLLFL